MKLIQLKTDDGSIWVNPDMIAFVEKTGRGSQIVFAAIGDGDSILARSVALSPDEIIVQINSG